MELNWKDYYEQSFCKTNISWEKILLMNAKLCGIDDPWLGVTVLWLNVLAPVLCDSSPGGC